MSCYHPRLMYQSLKPYDNGSERYIFLKNESLPPHEFLNSLDPLTRDKFIMVPCKKCIGCRLDYSRRWADRLMLELDHTGCAIFVTLTYNDKNLSYGSSVYVPDPLTGEALPKTFPTLVKEDVQLFHKRLRERFSFKQIRFFTAGEYGPSSCRPHYHSIYFGLSLDDFVDKKLHSYNRYGQPIYSSALLESIWSHGFVSIANVSWQSCAYVARYSLKKLGSEKGFAESRGCLPEFSLMSRRPGIAGYFIYDHPECLDNPNDKIFISDVNGVKSKNSINLPEYLFNKLESYNPLLYNQIKEERKVSANDRFFHEYLKQDLDELSYLALKESRHEDGVVSLRRDNFMEVIK